MTEFLNLAEGILKSEEALAKALNEAVQKFGFSYVQNATLYYHEGNSRGFGKPYKLHTYVISSNPRETSNLQTKTMREE